MGRHVFHNSAFNSDYLDHKVIGGYSVAVLPDLVLYIGKLKEGHRAFAVAIQITLISMKGFHVALLWERRVYIPMLDFDGTIVYTYMHDDGVMMMMLIVSNHN